MLPALRSRPRLAIPAHVALLVPALFLAIALVFGTSAAPATTADLPLVIEEVTSIGGGVPVVAFAGSYAYVGEGGGLSILDISNPERFVRIARLDLRGESASFTPICIQLVGNRVYIGSKYWGGIAIVDVSNPSQPALLGRSGGFNAEFIAVMGDRIYLLESDGISTPPYLRGLDIQDPAHPVKLWGWAPMVTGEGTGLFAADGLVYITDMTTGLTIVDVQSTSEPTLLGRYTVTRAHDIAVVGDLAYLAVSEAGVQIIDIHDPTHPSLLGSYDTPADTYRAAKVHVDGNRLYVAATYNSFTGLQVFDLSNPVSPLLLGSLSGVQDVHILQAVDGWVSVLDAGAWQLIDWNIPAKAIPHGRYPIIASANDLQVENDRAYIASDIGGGLQIIDISDPKNPMQLGHNASSNAANLQVRDNLAYVLDPIAYGGLRIIDISTVTNTVQIGQYSMSFQRRDIQLAGNLVYVAATYDGLQIIDVSNPISPTLRGTSTTAGNNTVYIHVEEQLAYTLDNRLPGNGPNLLHAIDVSDPSNPTILGSYQDSVGMSVTEGMDVVDDIAYIPTGQSLQMIDVSDPAHLTKLGSYAVPSWGVRVVGPRAYVSTSSGLDIVDVSDPTLPVLLGSYTGSVGEAEHIEVVGDLVYIAAGWHGLSILRVVDPTAEEPQLTINHPTGMPGSAFTIQGSHFRPGTHLDVGVNDILVGTLTADSAGAFTLVLMTSPTAAPGTYAVSVTKTQPAATGTNEVYYTLAADAPLREHESPPGGVDLAVPADVQPLPAYGIYLPLVRD